LPYPKVPAASALSTNQAQGALVGADLVQIVESVELQKYEYTQGAPFPHY
jgi:hypothetical protein